MLVCLSFLIAIATILRIFWSFIHVRLFLNSISLNKVSPPLGKQLKYEDHCFFKIIPILNLIIYNPNRVTFQYNNISGAYNINEQIKYI